MLFFGFGVSTLVLVAEMVTKGVQDVNAAFLASAACSKTAGRSTRIGHKARIAMSKDSVRNQATYRRC